MIIKNKKIGNKQRYLRYDDVFMSDHSTRRYSNSKHDNTFQNQNGSSRSDKFNGNGISNFDDEDGLEYDDYDRAPESPQFSRNDLMDEKILKYQKRRLPNLQRYTQNSHKDMYSEFNKSYWDDEDYRPQRGYSTAILGKIWQKFIVTFTSILSLVCISWIAYNWNNSSSSMRSDEPLIIEPEHPSFKILPENPGGADVSYKDKTIYNMVDNGISSLEPDERLLPQQEEASLPTVRHQLAPGSDVEEYSILEDRTYYIKISAGKSKKILKDESKLLEKKYSVLLSGKKCMVRKVSSSTGEQKYAILIGPYESQDGAVEIARNIDKQCYVISVRE
ncbi:MAG: hypothetical protein LBB34_02175 [Holosporales bacterium]|jgi:hypothetical protein|nr:hypothetical protein [Holosporales bacterium]